MLKWIFKLRVKSITSKYENDLSVFFVNASKREIKIVLKFVASCANDDQRKTVKKAKKAMA